MNIVCEILLPRPCPSPLSADLVVHQSDVSDGVPLHLQRHAVLGGLQDGHGILVGHVHHRLAVHLRQEGGGKRH